MTSFLGIRLLSSTRLITSQCKILTATTTHPLNNLDLVRLAGHSKWQNIAGTKSVNDQAKGKLCSRYVMMVRKAILANGRQTDPKLNSKLAAVLSEAAKLNVPKATLERAIERSKNIKMINMTAEIEGPKKSSVIVRCETENPSLCRRELKKVCKKFNANLLTDNTVINLFQSQGFIRCTRKTNDNREISDDFAEEAAIMGGAEEFYVESNPDSKDEQLKELLVFTTDAHTMNQCRGELEKFGLNVISADLELVPYRTVNFGEEVHEEIERLSSALRELEEVIEVYHNVDPPALSQATN